MEKNQVKKSIQTTSNPQTPSLDHTKRLHFLDSYLMYFLIDMINYQVNYIVLVIHAKTVDLYIR